MDNMNKPFYKTHEAIALAHITIIVPFLLYIATQKASMPIFMFQFLKGFGVVIILYHLYKTYVKYMANSPNWWSNLIHVLLVGPLLIYIGYMEKDTPRAAYELVFLLAFAAAGYQLKTLAEVVAGPGVIVREI